MIFTPTSIEGVFLIDLDRKADDRGFFADTFCAREFEQHGLKYKIAQCKLSFNPSKGTLRGMHYQGNPAAQAKIVRCTRGSIYDVIIDLRPDSPSYRQHIGVELTAENRRSLYVPEGFAHGYQTLTDETEVSYLTTEFYTPACEGGVRFDDPAFGIVWPLPISKISAKDAAWHYM
jgi:dTDP-4-dehydrorhamnose 3,5-epimerase